MAVNHVEIKNFLVFKGEFAVDFCPGMNVFIGGNGTGKTTLLRAVYDYRLFPKSSTVSTLTDNRWGDLINKGYTRNEISENSITVSPAVSVKNRVYIPEKDILEHAKGLLSFIEEKETGFSWIYRDALIKAQDVPTRKQSESQRRIWKIIYDIIGGEVKWDQEKGYFYTIKENGDRILFATEASGFKKLGFLGLLVAESLDILQPSM
ncbi:MAG: AAA family ATPase [Clostridiales Family XIII bacterium]|jgi:AAA15 family ATPase/GTPase|nr:AAA family ATPase [Clostridiales Family XIII bacterium]